VKKFSNTFVRKAIPKVLLYYLSFITTTEERSAQQSSCPSNRNQNMFMSKTLEEMQNKKCNRKMENKAKTAY